jgi:protein-L-isoaspartate(D-aspartate) O-methyltransferase
MEDSYRHKGMRKKMVEELREKGINDEQVLEAMYNVPRHFFLSSAFLEFAYQNKAFQIGAGQTISHPFTVAFQSELLQVNKGDKILEIGTGSGFQTCILSEMKAKVFSIERQKTLFDRTKKLIAKLGYSPKLFYGDGYKGKEAFAPYDKIIVTCGAPEVPMSLLNQLKVGGIMIIPVGDGDSQVMLELRKISEKEVIKKEHGNFSFVPMLEAREIRND